MDVALPTRSIRIPTRTSRTSIVGISKAVKERAITCDERHMMSLRALYAEVNVFAFLRPPLKRWPLAGILGACSPVVDQKGAAMTYREDLAVVECDLFELVGDL